MFDSPIMIIVAGLGVLVILVMKGYIKLPDSVMGGLKKSGQEAVQAAQTAKLSVEDLAGALVDLIRKEEQAKVAESAKAAALQKIREAISPTSPVSQEVAGK